LVKGKGGGMIFLLHGKPGVGKTYTAESVAQEINSPLISLTSADIGTDLDKLEQNLEHWFRLGKRWGAVLLIDEADIYLEQRAVNDLARNMLVAAFLRTLEYFEGILFLTTNRVGTFDEALLSRVDVKIYYKDFTDEQRAGLWNTFFTKLQDERENEMRVHRSARDYVVEDKTLRSLKWNARDIRNGKSDPNS
jgi:SpoVK/Ycf46/Vps4 family AAA+-type ATPase